MSATIETFTGVMFDLINPRIEDINIEDIAHAGSQLCRFTGHTKYHYSIAYHELLGSYRIPREFALEFLLHDAAESYVNDMSRPLKHMTECGKHYRPVEENIQALIRQKYGLPAVQSPIIHEIDNAMLLAEKEQLMPKNKWSEEDNTACLVSGHAAKVKIYECQPKHVKKSYLERFHQLTEGKYDRETLREVDYNQTSCV
jgi:uncharacterized protein